MLSLCCLVLSQLAIIVLRFVFDTGIVWLHDIVFYTFAIAILWSMVIYIQENFILRIDIIDKYANPIYQKYLKYFCYYGIILPFSLFLMWVSYDMMIRSVMIKEGSLLYGGLPIYWLKALLFVFPIQILLKLIIIVQENLR